MENIFIYIALAAIVTIAVVGSFYTKKAVIKRKLKKAGIKKISEFMNGDVARLVGKVEFVDQPLVSPLSGRTCSHYYVLVEKSSGSKNSSWEKLIEEEVSSKFVIRDGAHCAFIHAQNIKSYIVQDRRYSSGLLEDATDVLEKYLNAHGHESEGILGFNKTLRYHEGILENNEEIAVYGKGEWKDASHVGLPQHYGKVLVITSHDEESVYLSDDPDTTED